MFRCKPEKWRAVKAQVSFSAISIVFVASFHACALVQETMTTGEGFVSKTGDDRGKTKSVLYKSRQPFEHDAVI